MVLESGKITEEGVERLRSRLGNFNRPRKYGVGLFKEDASRSAIRHFCQGIGDINTLYWAGATPRPPNTARSSLPHAFCTASTGVRGVPGGYLECTASTPATIGSGTVPSIWTTSSRCRSSSPDWKRKRASLPATSSSSPAYLTTSINGVRRSPILADGRSAPSAAPPGSGKSIPSSLTPILERRFSRFKTR